MKAIGLRWEAEYTASSNFKGKSTYSLTILSNFLLKSLTRPIDRIRERMVMSSYLRVWEMVKTT